MKDACGRLIDGSSLKGASSSFAALMEKIFQLIRALQPASHVPPDEEASTPSRLRGNLALLVSCLSDRQALEGVTATLRDTRSL